MHSVGQPKTVRPPVRLSALPSLDGPQRMRAYKVKPIDKIIPRRIYDAGLEVSIANAPVFFRAPMLSSKIHQKWDSAFCRSTSTQLELVNLSWDNVWLTAAERETGKRNGRALKR